MADSCAECCCCCAICFACCTLFERVCFWIPLPEKLRRKTKEQDDDEYFATQATREADLFHSQGHSTTTREPTPMAPMYDPRQPPHGPPPSNHMNNTPTPGPPGMNNGNASRRAFLDELHEDRRPQHRTSPSTGHYPPTNMGQYPPENNQYYPPENSQYYPPANPQRPIGSSPPAQPGFPPHTPTTPTPPKDT